MLLLIPDPGSCFLAIPAGVKKASHPDLDSHHCLFEIIQINLLALKMSQEFADPEVKIHFNFKSGQF
jgi:hypothetical protein